MGVKENIKNKIFITLFFIFELQCWPSIFDNFLFNIKGGLKKHQKKLYMKTSWGLESWKTSTTINYFKAISYLQKINLCMRDTQPQCTF